MDSTLIELVKSQPEAMIGWIAFTLYLVRQNYALTKQNHDLIVSIMKAAASLKESSMVMGEINRTLKNRRSGDGNH